MNAALIVLTILGCFALPRWYGFGVAASVMGVCWAPFAWFPQTIPYTAPIAFVVVAALVARGVLRERAQRVS